MTATRSTAARLLVHPEVPAETDALRLQLTLMTRAEWSKTAVNSALIRVAARHLDEVAEELRAGIGTDA